ncbi:MAG: S1C family serine protease [Clostridiales bacterium]|jgi:S1-C subfamily serine protease|nr:S1C family serine protease [Clostridiales bacterium]
MNGKKIRGLMLFCLVIALVFSLSSCFTKSGKSAYEIAVDNGFVGSETDWLASLKGLSGSDGTDAESPSIEDIYEAYLNNGGNLGFDDFLREYLSANYTPVDKATNEALRSVVAVTAGFSSGTLLGAGVIFKLDQETGTAYIITNYHVIYDSAISANISVYLYGHEGRAGYAVPASYIGGSADNDIAVLIASGSNTIKNSQTAAAATVADSDDVYPGGTVIAVGNAQGRGISVTKGVVSLDSEEIYMNKITGSGMVAMRVMRVDAAINGGNSGGGLFNEDGEIIGIVNAKTANEEIENMAYAIPSNIAFGIAENIIYNNGSAKKANLGITTSVVDISQIEDPVTGRVKIVHTVNVIAAMSAPAQGKLSFNDTILSLTLKSSTGVVKAQKDITRNFMITDFIFNARPNDILVIRVKRGMTQVDVQMTLFSQYFSTVA